MHCFVDDFDENSNSRGLAFKRIVAKRKVRFFSSAVFHFEYLIFINICCYILLNACLCVFVAAAGAEFGKLYNKNVRVIRSIEH